MRILLAWLPWIPMTFLLGTSCSTVQTSSQSDVDFQSYETYAWLKTPLGSSTTEPIGDEVLRARVESTADIELAAAGLKKVPPGKADLLVASGSLVETRTIDGDPYYSLYVMEQYEEGTLILEFHDRKSREMVWRGSLRERLRYTARATGSSGGSRTLRFESTQAPRVWHAEEMVRKILARLPR